MKRKLTLAQRQAMLKWGCLLLSAAMVVGAFCAVPYIVSALPQIEHTSKNEHTVGMNGNGSGRPNYGLGAGSFAKPEEESKDPECEFETETLIPIPTPGEYDLPVSQSNLAWYEINETPALNIINRTKFKIDLSDYLKREYTVGESIGEEPIVLIMHTHGSESYLENGHDFYSPDETFRSRDEEKTVVHIGDVLCNKLNELGIPAVHDKTMYDLTDFNRSYNYSREGIKEMLAKYPTLRFVIDLHRDSVFDSDNNNIKPLTTLNGKECAQLMLVVGTNEGGADHPNWRENLTFATHLQQKMNDLYPTLARPINLRSAAFNQALTKGSVLLEVGSCGNTLEEAENAVLLFAQAYSAIIKEKMK